MRARFDELIQVLPIAALCIAATGVAAADPVGEDAAAPGAESAPPQDGDIGLEEFRRLFIGKTVYFVLEDGSDWGREYYDPDGRRTIFKYWSGRCFEGRWDQQDGDYCFHYRNDMSCWRTYWRDGEIHVQSRNGQRQRVSAIKENEPLSCAPEGVSRLRGPGDPIG